MVAAVEDQHIVVLEILLEREPDMLLGPAAVETAADMLDRFFRMGNAVHLAQHALAMIDQRAREQRLLMLDRHLVGALGRGKHSDNDADDGDRNDGANRDNDAQTRAIPAGVVALGLCLRPTRYRRRLVP